MQTAKADEGYRTFHRRSIIGLISAWRFASPVSCAFRHFVLVPDSQMLSLKSTSDAAWLRQVDESLEEILIDHAHCEHKAAATAMSLLGSYIENNDLCEEMTRIVQEELEHFHMVLQLLQARGITFRRLQPAHYGRELNALVRPHEPDRAVDRLLIASLIEARSCERFQLLAAHVQDPVLADFYRSLFESEARHHTTYVRLAKHFADEVRVRARLGELADRESEIIGRGNSLPRMHS
jgi:tRNA-(ms[2]io[6]A)-hydroxylase